ncbi:hypothetical protein GCM10010219_42600 [Streptomyces netropsis]|nr:hypothetical protein GCM10010219_42600 [Streptomyces netropsis]
MRQQMQRREGPGAVTEVLPQGVDARWHSLDIEDEAEDGSAVVMDEEPVGDSGYGGAVCKGRLRSTADR